MEALGLIVGWKVHSASLAWTYHNNRNNESNLFKIKIDHYAMRITHLSNSFFDPFLLL
jgi:hypothetical protein